MIMIMIMIMIIMVVVENDEVRITWDTTIYTDKKLKHNRPDITVMQRNTKEWTLIDIAVPTDQNVSKTEHEKVEKYQELAFETKSATEPPTCQWRLLWWGPLEQLPRVQGPGTGK